MAKIVDKIGGYHLVRRLATGGQGQVFAAVKGEGTCEVALKLIKASHPKKRDRFIREIKVHAALSSQNATSVMQLLDHNLEELSDGGVSGYLVMPLAHQSMAEALPSLTGRVELCLDLFEDIVSAIKCAHQADVIHRDIKPANILFLDRYLRRPYVSDFGICFLKESEEERLTETGETVGAKYFMAPEQERGGAVDVTFAADLYALGKLLHYMLTGRYLYREELQKAFTDDELRAEPRFETVIDQILKRTVIEKPGDRMQTADELLAAVQQLRRLIRSGGRDAGGDAGNQARKAIQLGIAESQGSAAALSIADEFHRLCELLVRGEERRVSLEVDDIRRDFRRVWEDIYNQVKNQPERSVEVASELLGRLPRMAAITLSVARIDAEGVGQELRKLLEFITRSSEGRSGYARIFTIPHLQAGFLYMACAVMALHNESWSVLAQLLSDKYEWYYQSGRPFYSEGFRHSYFFHPEAIGRDAAKAHDFFRDRLAAEEIVQVTDLGGEEVLNAYIQCQFLMSLRAAQLAEKDSDKMWPDFGRFYDYRVVPLLDRIHSNVKYGEGVLRAFGEDRTTFFERLNTRLKTLQSWFRNSRYWWASIVSWEPR